MADKDVKITLTATDKTKAAFSSAQKGLNGLSRDAERAGSKIKSAFGQLGLTIGAGYAARSIAGMADEFANLQARLKLASRDQNEFNDANADLVRIAQAAKAPLSETATLYTRIAASVKDLNVSQDAIASTTEAVALALRISGASAAEASSAMLQFSQAIASGVLRGEEFNAVNESAPRLMQALAKSLDVPVGSLREMAKEGQLTRDILINGLLAELPTLQREAASLPETIGAAFTDLQNKLILTIGEFDKLTGVTGGFSKALNEIGTTGIEALAVLGANVAFVFRGIGTEIGGIAAQLSRLAVGDFKGFSEIGRMMREDAARARKDLDDFERRILGLSDKAAGKSAASAGVRASVSLPTPKTKGGGTRAKTDPLGGLLSQTETARAAEYDKLLGLLEKRFDAGKLKAGQYGEALAVLNKQFGREALDPLGSGSFATTSKDVADFIREQQDAINDLNVEMAQEGVAAAQAYESALASLLADTTVAKTAELYENIDILNRAFFDGAIGAAQYEEAVARLTSGADTATSGLEEMNVFAKRAAENIQDAFADFLFDPFEGGIEGMVDGFAQAMRRMVAEAMAADLAKTLFGSLSGGEGSGLIGDFFGTLFGGMTANADGNVFANAPGLSAYSGSVVSRPTLFPFASGGVPNIGLMGEAGAEAILPLKRGKNGKLGVESSGGSSPTVININGVSDFESFRRSEGQVTAQAARMLQRARRNM